MALEFNGTPPNLEGQILDEMVCVEYWHDGKISDEANAVIIFAANKWYRLYFDSGVIFWREDGNEYLEMEDGDLDSVFFKRIDIASKMNTKGLKITRQYAEVVNQWGSKVVFSFSNGTTIEFINIDDSTKMKIT